MTAKKTTATATKKKPKQAKPPKPKKLSALDAAAQVLAESGESMTTQEMIETMATKKLWESPNGKTPAATLYSAILRELTTKGNDSRFKKTEPGKFAATAATGKADAKPTEENAIPAAKSKSTKPKAAKSATSAKKKAVKKPAEPAPVEATIPDGADGPESMKELFRL